MNSERADRDEVVRVQVGEVGDLHQPVLVQRPRLDARLDEHVEQALEVDDLGRVAERLVPGASAFPATIARTSS